MIGVDHKLILGHALAPIWLGSCGAMCDNDYAAPRDPFACQVSLPPLFSILHGRRELGYRELGYVDEMTFLGKQEGPHVLLLGRRA